ncbi:FecR/PupR family sigma factor regulator [Novosphingobium panipatense]
MADDMTTEGIIREQALQWAVRLGDPAFDDWDGFTLWLEADPRHAVAYDHIAAAVGEASEDLATATPANENPEEHHDVPAVRSGRRPVWLAGALAASLAAVAAIWVVQGSGRDLYTVETAFGQTEVVTLEPGTHVELAGALPSSLTARTNATPDCNAGRPCSPSNIIRPLRSKSMWPTNGWWTSARFSTCVMTMKA